MEDKNVVVKEWIRFALTDFNTAQYLLNMHPIPIEIVCYHCQQAAEKVLKAYLIYNNIEPPYTHVLKLLCKLCSDIDIGFDEISEQCGNLTLYGVQPRYPFEIEVTDGDMNEAIIDVHVIIEFVLSKIR